MKLLEEGYLLLAKPRVVHSIPGRLRLQIPLLKRVGREHQEVATHLSRLLKMPDGIDDVSVSHVTGTVLFHYDVQALSEREILSFIAAVNRVFVAQKEDVLRLLEKDSDTVYAYLKKWLQKTIKRQLHLDTNQRILPDDFC